MAYPGTPADVSDGNILSASYLNQLADCAAYLQGIGAPPNVGFLEQAHGDAVVLQWRDRHRHRYLKMLYSCTGGGTVNYIRLYYNDVLVWSDESPDLASEVTITVDLNDTGVITPTPTVGSWYTTKVDMAFYSGGAATIHLLCQQSATGDL